MSRIVQACLLIAAFAMALPANSAGTVEDVKALVEQGKSAQAYDLAAQHPELLGDPAFDYYYGVAAVDAGHAGEGVLALERYLIRFPANTVARVELARAYFVLGEDARAREEFQNVSKEKPPAAVQATIDRYTDAIRTRESRYRTTSSFYLEAGFGSDSNVNGGVGNSNITLPVLGNVNVAAAGVKKGDNFTHLAAGGQVNHPVAPGLALFGGAGVEAKLNSSEHAFDLLNTALAGGVSMLKDKDLYRLSLSQNTLSVESDRFRTTTGVAGEWNHQLDELQSLQGSVQSARFAYTGANEVRGADYVGVGLNYRRSFISGWQPIMNLGVNYAKEDNTRNRPDLGRDIGGLRASLGLTPAAKWGVNAGVTYLESRYNGPDAILLTTRKDKYTAYDLTVTYLYSKNISLRGELLLSDNSSNTSLYQYKRDMLSFKVRYEFK